MTDGSSQRRSGHVKDWYADYYYSPIAKHHTKTKMSILALREHMQNYLFHIVFMICERTKANAIWIIGRQHGTTSAF